MSRKGKGKGRPHCRGEMLHVSSTTLLPVVNTQYCADYACRTRIDGDNLVLYRGEGGVKPLKAYRTAILFSSAYRSQLANVTRETPFTCGKILSRVNQCDHECTHSVVYIDVSWCQQLLQSRDFVNLLRFSLCGCTILCCIQCKARRSAQDNAVSEHHTTVTLSRPKTTLYSYKMVAHTWDHRYLKRNGDDSETRGFTNACAKCGPPSPSGNTSTNCVPQSVFLRPCR